MTRHGWRDRRPAGADRARLYEGGAADKPAVPFCVPAGIKLIRIDRKSGMRAAPGDQRVILEAFKPGTAPPDKCSAIGVTDAEGRPLGLSSEADRAVRSTGTAGLW
jgi:penicillin-binding protein 1A